MSETTKAQRAQAFEQWFLANYRSRVILTRPEWHAPKIYRAATHEAERRIAELERTVDLLAATARRLAGERDAALACGTEGESRTEGEDTDAAVRDARLAEQGQRRLPRVKHRGPAPDVPTAAAPARTGEAGR